MDDIHIPGSQGRHKNLISAIASLHDLEVGGFWRCVRELHHIHDWDGYEKLSFVPDAFKVDGERKCVELHEAIVTHPPSRRALLAMGYFWFLLDCEEWDARLFLHRADEVAASEISLYAWYYEGLGNRSEIEEAA